MRTNKWRRLAIALALALVGSFLLLPRWSPLNVTTHRESAEIAAPTPQSEGIASGGRAAVTPPSPSPTPEPSPTITASPVPAATSVPTPAEAAGPSPTAMPAPTAAASSSSEAGASPEEQDSPTVEELILATEDTEWKNRWDAVNALGILEDPRGIPALVRRALYDDNSHPCWRSLWALAAVDREATEAIPEFIDALEDGDPFVVRNAAIALAFFSRPQAVPELLHGLADSDSYRRWEAVFSLGNVGNVDVAAVLSSLLNDGTESETRVRQEAALTLGRIGGEEVIEPLLNAMRDDPASNVRWRAALALSRIGFASVVDELKDALPEEEDPQVRQSIEDAIAALATP